MKSFSTFAFLYLVMPGSGQLVWDGLPFSTRAEVAALVLFVVVFFSREIRSTLREWLKQSQLKTLASFLLLGLAFVKFFTFAWSPMSAGFESCYRSLYNVLPEASACERSFEAPFLRARGLPNTNATRVEHIVDFGEAPYDWSLPFMNDYPRLGALWLSRFPFAAGFSARLNGIDADQVLPVFGIGEVSVKINGTTVSQTEAYDREFVAAVPLLPGANDVVVDYAYRDDEESVPPDKEPQPRGPYARLKIGEPMSVGDLAEVTWVRVTGTSRSPDSTPLTDIRIRDRTGGVVEFNDVNTQRTSNGGEQDPLLRVFDLEVEIPAAALFDGPLTVETLHDGNATLLGRIVAAPGQLTPRVEQSAAANALAALSSSLTADRDSLTALAPSVRDTPPLALRLLLLLVDLASLGLLAALAYLLLRTMRTALLQALILAVGAWIAVEPLDAILPGFVGGGRELVIPYALLALLIVALRKPIQRFPIPFLLPTATVLAAQKVFEHLRNNHPGHGNQWWGQLIYQWRDSDWLANSGNARAILVESSLRGGEDVFWFRAATRYLLYSGQMLLGENSVLLGLIAVTLGYLVVFTLAARVPGVTEGASGTKLGVIVAFIGAIFIGDQIIVAFGFFVSSEYPTWLALFAVTAFLVDPSREHRPWVIVSVSAMLAVLVQFRPNGLFVSLVLFSLVLCFKVNYEFRRSGFHLAIASVAAFLVVMSLSLLHNLYYGGEFVPFTPNPTLIYVFDPIAVFKQDGPLGVLREGWSQFAAVMYWRPPYDPNFMIFFWGCQAALAASILLRARSRTLWKPLSLVVLLPLTYIAPMLPFALDSYYPRLTVTASLLCLTSALLVWPRTWRPVTTSK